MSTGIAEGDGTARMQPPPARTRILRAVGLGLTGGAAFLFICRDIARASTAVCIAGTVVGVLVGIALGLAVDPEAEPRSEPPG